MEDRESPEASNAQERVIRLLARGAQTVEELAAGLDITPNAVRAQLALLRREGIVEEAGRARGARRPSVIYGLRKGAEVRLSRAYPLAFARLVETAAAKLRPAAFVELLRATGRRMAAAFLPGSGDAGERAAAAAAALEKLGSRVQVTKQGAKLLLRGDACPLGEAVAADERTCAAVAAMLEEVTGLAVSECCEHGDHPRCGFVLRARKG
jgi:predicted ArsR family transcriptional regulator